MPKNALHCSAIRDLEAAINVSFQLDSVIFFSINLIFATVESTSKFRTYEGFFCFRPMDGICKKILFMPDSSTLFLVSNECSTVELLLIHLLRSVQIRFAIVAEIKTHVEAAKK